MFFSVDAQYVDNFTTDQIFKSIQKPLIKETFWKFFEFFNKEINQEMI